MYISMYMYKIMYLCKHMRKTSTNFICIYTYIWTYTHMHKIHLHIYIYIHTMAQQKYSLHFWVRGRQYLHTVGPKVALTSCTWSRVRIAVLQVFT